MILINDIATGFNSRSSAQIIAELGLPADITVYEDTEELPPLGNVDRVIFVTTFASGIKGYHCSIVRNNAGVSEWFVLSSGTAQNILDVFIAQTTDNTGRMFVFSSAEEMKKALERPPVRPDSCLVCAKSRDVRIDDFVSLMKKTMPGYNFEAAYLSDDPDAIENSSCEKVIIAGHETIDFALPKAIPDGISPVIVLINLAGTYKRDLPTTKELVFLNLGLNLFKEQQDRCFFSIYVQFENWRIALREKTLSHQVLRKDPMFYMWDKFLLPLVPEDYTDERMDEFLAGFDIAEKISSRLR